MNCAVVFPTGSESNTSGFPSGRNKYEDAKSDRKASNILYELLFGCCYNAFRTVDPELIRQSSLMLVSNFLLRFID